MQAGFGIEVLTGKAQRLCDVVGGRLQGVAKAVITASPGDEAAAVGEFG